PSGSDMTTNAGRFWLSVPSPYVTHEPTHGKPMRFIPVLIWKRAGEWLFVSVKHEWMKARSSTCSTRCGKISDAHVPDLPYCLNWNGDLRSGPTSAVKKPVFLSKPGKSWPSRLASSGL